MMPLPAKASRSDNLVLAGAERVPTPDPLWEPDIIAPDATSEAPVSAQWTLAPRNLRPLGQILIEDGAVRPADLVRATILRRRQNVRLGEILLSHGWVTEDALTHALSRQWRTSVLDLVATPPDPRLIDAAGADFCLTHAMVPWRRVGGVTWVATARPEAFGDAVAKLPASFGTVRMLLCSEIQAQEAILVPRRTALIRRAETRVAASESCRTIDPARSTRIAAAVIGVTVLGMWLAPILILSLLAGWATLTLLAGSVLKLLAFRAALQANRERRAEISDLAEAKTSAAEMDAPLPLISVMVPLFRESDVAGKLVQRLSRLTYPRELTDILLVAEASDDITCAALARADLPRWMRVVKVPDGPIKTKPRALNYALNFCRGEIVGVWDAEDRPEPDQLHKIARGFHFAAPDVACLQGALDFYNPRSNWLARCFTIEYCAWFRGLLPGIARLGLVVPLGGTTLFFRRHVLEQLGGWDAHNVTEDADLGVRLARRGWRTEIVDTTTDEEANCRALRWVKQRSRWLKGYAMTWGVHMRDPALLWSELGPRRFIAFQIQFLGTLSQYLLAPVLWSFWLLSFGLPHPLRPVLAGVWGGNAIAVLFTVFVLSEVLSMAMGIWAVRGAKHRHLTAWVPTLHLYFPLGCLAGWKAIYEVVAKPFYWDKTTHGLFDAALPIEVSPPDTATLGPEAVLPGSVALPVLGQIGGRSLSDLADAAATDGTTLAMPPAPGQPLAVLGSGIVAGPSSPLASGIEHGEIANLPARVAS